MKIATFLALLIVVLSSCSTPVSGEHPEPSEPGFTPRPRELPVDSIDPCALLTSDQVDRLGVSGGTANLAPDGSGRAICQWARFPAEPQDSYLVSLDTDRGAEYAFGSAAGYRVTTVLSFSAIEAQRMDAPADTHCLITVDVAAGQNLVLRYDYDGSTVPMTRELACEKAAVAAEMVINTLDDLVGG